RLVDCCRPNSAYRQRELLQIARAHLEIKPDLVIAFDLENASSARGLARTTGAASVVDLSEYPVGRFDSDSDWTRDDKPIVVSTQQHYLGCTDMVIAVSEGLAQVLASEARLKRAPIVIRNLPTNQPQKFRPVGERIKVLYQGDLSRHRELAV